MCDCSSEGIISLKSPSGCSEINAIFMPNKHWENVENTWKTQKVLS